MQVMTGKHFILTHDYVKVTKVLSTCSIFILLLVLGGGVFVFVLDTLQQSQIGLRLRKG